MATKKIAVKDRFFEFIELNYGNLTTQVNNWLSTVYNRSDIQFNATSPYGQILSVSKELFTHNILYLKNIVDQLNIELVTDERILRYIARISGHNPMRAVSASGVLKFKLKGGINIFDELDTSDPRIVIPNKTKLKNNTNSLNYVVNLGNVNQQKYTLLPGSVFYLNILQGKFETQTFTADGENNQSYTVITSNNTNIDNFNYRIFYNGQQIKVVDHYWDMLPNEMACVTRTGFNGGMEIYFGNVDYGFVPSSGSIITVDYLITNGTAGEILNPVINDWKFEDDVKSDSGENVDLSELFDITVEVDINFASNGETPEVTKAIVPRVSRNFVLATPDQFKFHLLKLNMFSQVDAYNKLGDNDFSSTVTNQSLQNQINILKKSINQGKNKTDLLNMVNSVEKSSKELYYNTNDNIIFLFLVPKITKYLNSTTNYFNLPFDVFYLDDYEKQKTMNYLKSQGIISITTEIRIVQPVISRYICNVNVTRYEDSTEDNIKQQILDELSDYFINNERPDRVVKSDIIKTLKNNIKGLDSVDVFFICKKNEDYHKKGSELGLKADALNKNTYDPNSVLGIDPILGDIIVEKNEYPLIRGGWQDRDGIYFGESPNYKGLTSINISFGKTTPK